MTSMSTNKQTNKQTHVVMMRSVSLLLLLSLHDVKNAELVELSKQRWFSWRVIKGVRAYAVAAPDSSARIRAQGHDAPLYYSNTNTIKRCTLYIIFIRLSKYKEVHM